MNIEFYDFENNDFVLILDEESATPIEKKTNYIEILDNNIKCVIGGNNYNINDNNLLRIKEYINNNINELVHFSMLETNGYLKENMLFGGGTSLYIKVGLLNLSINGSINAEIKNFCDNFISNIKNIIMN